MPIRSRDGAAAVAACACGSALIHRPVSQAWVAELAQDHSPATVQKIHRVPSLVLDMAVKDGRLARNVASGVNPPRVGTHEHRYLAHEQVDDLATATGYPAQPNKHSGLDTRANATYRLVVLFLAYTGVRFGELAAHITGKEPEDLVFAGIRNGQPLRASTFRTTFGAAARAIGVPDPHPHQLRHTAASLAIASGADVKVVQQMLGHGSATMTLDTYGHLFDDRLDEVGDAMDSARTAAQQRRSGSDAWPRVAPGWPQPESDPDEEAALTSDSACQDRLSKWYPRPDSNRRYRLERAAC